MDAFTVAIASGMTLKKVNKRQTFRLAWHFGFFQAIMPIIGWSVGVSVYHFIEKIDHWIAFLLLSLIGIRMIRSALKGDEDSIQTNDPTKRGTMVMLSIATSIDALAVGLSISMLQIAILKPALIIGFVALIFTAIGIHLGRIIGSNFNVGKYAEIIGGIVLFGIGVRILFEHGVFIISL
ncbi:MAG: manganese efflux pump [bacterium]|nr:MAG: manganese efflux pump [bacterium]